MFRASPAAQAWHEAMGRQDDHEIFECSLCVASELPRCEIGRRLQADARAAHEAMVAERYARLAVA